MCDEILFNLWAVWWICLLLLAVSSDKLEQEKRLKHALFWDSEIQWLICDLRLS